VLGRHEDGQCKAAQDTFGRALPLGVLGSDMDQLADEGQLGLRHPDGVREPFADVKIALVDVRLTAPQAAQVAAHLLAVGRDPASLDGKLGMPIGRLLDFLPRRLSPLARKSRTASERRGVGDRRETGVLSQPGVVVEAVASLPSSDGLLGEESLELRDPGTAGAVARQQVPLPFSAELLGPSHRLGVFGLGHRDRGRESHPLRLEEGQPVLGHPAGQCLPNQPGGIDLALEVVVGVAVAENRFELSQLIAGPPHGIVRAG
jgi:hypothetical protein